MYLKISGAYPAMAEPLGRPYIASLDALGLSVAPNLPLQEISYTAQACNDAFYDGETLIYNVDELLAMASSISILSLLHKFIICSIFNFLTSWNTLMI